MTAVQSSAVGLASESYNDEKSRNANSSDPEIATSNSSAAPDSTMEEDDVVRTVTGLKWFFAYGSVIASVLLFALDNTIVADIQPSIIDTYGDVKNLPWIGIAFQLGSIAILPLGQAYGIFNIKWTFIASVVVFEVGSVLCGAAPTMNALIVGRVIGGVGGSGVYVGGLTYISVTTNKHERPLYLSGIAMVWGIGSVIGPVIGGAFAHSSATWRWAFYINLVVAAVLAPAFFFCLPNVNPMDVSISKKLRLQDWVGIVIFSGGSACFTMAITFGGVVFPFSSASQITLWTMTGVLLIAFILATIYHPFVPAERKLYPAHFMKRLELNILQYQVFLASGAMMISVYYTPLLFQFTRGDSPLQAGVRILPLICMIVFFAILNGALMPKFGYHMPWYVFGNAMILTGSTLMFTIDSSTSPSAVYGYTSMIGIGVGCFLAAGFAVVQASVPLADVNNAVGFMSIGQAFGAIVFLAIGGALFQNIAFEKVHPILPDASRQDIQQLTAGTSSIIFKSLSGDVRQAVIDQITLSIRNGFAVMMVGSAFGFISSLFLSRKRLYAKTGEALK